MLEDCFSLRWDTYPAHVNSLLKNYLDPSSSTDVTFVFEDGRKFNTNKFVLSKCGPMLSKIVAIMPENNAMVYLMDVSYEEIKLLMSIIWKIICF